MPLRSLISQSDFCAEDIAYLETLFNQCVDAAAPEEDRHKFASDLVALFTSGVSSEAALVQRLVDRKPSVERHP